MRRLTASLFAVLTAISLPSGRVLGDMSSPAPAVQAGRDIHARDIIVNKGLTETEILAIVEAYQRTDSPSIAVVAQLSKELGITETALAGFFRTLGLERVPPERLLETLSTGVGLVWQT